MVLGLVGQGPRGAGDAFRTQLLMRKSTAANTKITLGLGDLRSAALFATRRLVELDLGRRQLDQLGRAHSDEENGGPSLIPAAFYQTSLPRSSLAPPIA